LKRKNDSKKSQSNHSYHTFKKKKKKNVIKQKYNKKEICVHLDFGKTNKNTKVKGYQVVMAIIYRLKTGCQWPQLPMK
jgi:hypothetical protein